MMNLVEAWGNYYFKTEDRFFKVERMFAVYNVYENVVDDINELRFSGSLDDCLSYLEGLNAHNYDPLAKYR